MNGRSKGEQALLYQSKENNGENHSRFGLAAVYAVKNSDVDPGSWSLSCGIEDGNVE